MIWGYPYFRKPPYIYIYMYIYIDMAHMVRFISLVHPVVKIDRCFSCLFIVCRSGPNFDRVPLLRHWGRLCFLVTWLSWACHESIPVDGLLHGDVLCNTPKKIEQLQVTNLENVGGPSSLPSWTYVSIFRGCCKWLIADPLDYENPQGLPVISWFITHYNPPCSIGIWGFPWGYPK